MHDKWLAAMDGLLKAAPELAEFDFTDRDYLKGLIDQWRDAKADLTARGITSVEEARKREGNMGAVDWYATVTAGQVALLARMVLRILDAVDAMDNRVKECEREVTRVPQDAFLLGIEAGVLFGAADNVRAAVCGKEHPEVVCRHIASPWSD